MASSDPAAKLSQTAQRVYSFLNVRFRRPTRPKADHLLSATCYLLDNGLDHLVVRGLGSSFST